WNRGVVLLGPRQCGKTTLARLIASQTESTYFDLEDPTDLARLTDPMLTLQSLRGLVILDEIQRRPQWMPALRVLLDRTPQPARFLLLGSASPDIIRGTSESLAGRIAYVDMAGFNLHEIDEEPMRTLWLRGGFPLSFTATTERRSVQWRNDFLRTFIERDLPGYGHRPAPEILRRFFSMVAHYHGQTWNGSEIARSLQVSHPTTRHYSDLLKGAFLLRQLPPWFENAGKRIVKSPKVYIRDSGLLHALLNIDTFSALEGHPKMGASWEGFALENLMSVLDERQAYFWATQSGAELDLFLLHGAKRLGVEFKYTSAPSITRSMHIAMTDLKLDDLYVVHPGTGEFPLAAHITAIGLRELMTQFVDQDRGSHGDRKSVPLSS
ncbi:MAG: ATP-binding protein, partial [Desulfuromonadales bacterium]|nr:ATP-binding protein [Desulfuromonadales bacterium]